MLQNSTVLTAPAATGGPQSSWAEEIFLIVFGNVLVEKHSTICCANSTLFTTSNVDVRSTWWLEALSVWTVCELWS